MVHGLRLLFSPWGFIVIGLILGATGGGLAWHGRTEKMPERSELTRVEGKVEQVMKRWTEKHGIKRDIKYELTLNTSDPKHKLLTLKEGQVTEAGASDTDGATVTALLRNDSTTDVWELIADGNVVVAYDNSRKKRAETLAWQAENGPYFAGAGAIVLLLGFVWRISTRESKAKTI